MDAAILCLVAQAVFQIDSSDAIRIENYFTPGEIALASQTAQSNVSPSLVPITLTNVLQLDHENYVTVIKMAEIVGWYRKNLIIYDFETQRSPKYIKGRDGVIQVPDLSIESVKAIAEHMLNETYMPDMITINVYSEELEPVNYHAKTRVLTINDKATISVLDGFHRLQGAVRALSINPELRQDIILSIRIFDTDTAKKYFGQINTINGVKRERLEELKQEKVSYVSVKHLQMHSDLKGKIASGSRVNEASGHLTTADILATAIDLEFEPKTTFEAKEIGTYLADFFNHLLGVFMVDFETGASSLRHPRMFAGYIVLAKYMKKNQIPLKKMNEIIEGIKTDLTLSELLSNNRGASLTLQRKVRDYIAELIPSDIPNAEE
nr:DNA sulfur modification protein DndB [Paenibacillus lutrae]